ncbi:MAG: VOC family protein [Firmicutes bacterium]|nr:VOC family protein [Bacillota bacterium]
MRRIVHTGIVVKNMEESVRFYTEVLGFKLAGQEEMPDVKLAFLEGENQAIELLEFAGAPPREKGGVIDHFAIAVDDIVSEISRLKDLGVPLETEEPREIMGGMKIFFFSGPNGEQIELVQAAK